MLGSVASSPLARSAVAALLALAVGGCGSSTSPPYGTQGAACYPPESDGGSGRCNDGLTCDGRICVPTAGGGGIVDTASEPPDAAPDGGDAAEANTATDGSADTHADGGAPETTSDAATEAGPHDGAALDAGTSDLGTSDASAADSGADSSGGDGSAEAAPATDAGADTTEAGGDAGADTAEAGGDA